MLRKSELIIPYGPVEFLMKENSNQRIAFDAVKKLTEELILEGKIISKKAILIAKNSGRETVTGKDIKLAYEQQKYYN